MSMTVTEGFLRCWVDIAVEGRRIDPFTLEKDIVLVIDPTDGLVWWPFLDAFFKSVVEFELAIEFSRFVARRCRRWPTFSVVLSVQDRSAANIVTQSQGSTSLWREVS